MKRAGIITFHNSYNCGSMLETYAIQKLVKEICDVNIINYSSAGQKELYSVFQKNTSIKNIIKNFLILPAYKKIKFNNKMYDDFKNRNFILSDIVDENSISKLKYDYIIAGSDQIWNVTIADYSSVYFLNWVNCGTKIAYAPSFGAKNPVKYYRNIEEIKKWLSSFDFMSIRENNGKAWIKELIGKEVPVLLDPTLLISKESYDEIIDSSCTPNSKYIFFYSPSFDEKICKFVKRISKKYNLKVITWSTKSYYIKFIRRFGFELPRYESPAVFLDLIKNAELVITTSYHGTIFSTIYKKRFYVIKNGEMYNTDDRVATLINQIRLYDRFIDCNYNDNFDYLSDIDYLNGYDIDILKHDSLNFLKKVLDKDVE